MTHESGDLPGRMSAKASQGTEGFVQGDILGY